MAFTVVGIGEVLWDLLPGGKQLGGAPGNFIYHTAMLGDTGIAASRVGRDALGDEALAKLRGLGMSTEHLQQDASHPTGTVEVTVDASGQPDYVIHTEVAWDFLEWTPAWGALADSADAVCFGSLGQRSPVSRATIQRFARQVDGAKIFDVNLRQSFFSAEILGESLALATIAKLNDDELPRVCELLGLAVSDEIAMTHSLREVFGLDLVCITRGSKGCLLVTPEELHEEPGLPVKVADTVGAGDAFTAALVHLYLRGTSLQRIASGANQLGAWVATQAGGTPNADPAVLANVKGG